jgi:hypothetical protein
MTCFINANDSSVNKEYGYQWAALEKKQLSKDKT